MKISLSIFLDSISALNIEPHDVAKDKKFDQVDVVEGDPCFTDPDHLYVGLLSVVSSRAKENPDAVFIALRDRFNRDADRLPNVIIVNDDVSVQRLFSLLNNTYSRLVRWQEKMQSVIIHEQPIQDLLVASQDVIDNFISISDSALLLLAYTPDIPIDDPVSERLIKNGYHNDETITFFKRSGRFMLWQNCDGLLMDTEKITSPYPVVSRVFRYDGVYYTHVVMVCNRHGITDGLIDKFNILLENVFIYLSKMNCSSPEYDKDKNYLINRILDGADVNPHTISEGPGLLSLGDRKRFWLLLLLPDKNVTTPMGIISHKIRSVIPDAKLTVYRQSLLALFSADAADDTKPDGDLSKIEPILKSEGFHCGVSSEFSSLASLKDAYRQSTLAMTYGNNLVNLVYSPKFSGPIFRYEDYYIYMVLPAPDNLLTVKNSRAYALLSDIRENDISRGTNNFQLLYIYLSTACHAGNTAKALYMSRNNVAYRLQRLVDTYGFDLDDYVTRMELQITYEILHLYPAL